MSTRADRIGTVLIVGCALALLAGIGFTQLLQPKESSGPVTGEDEYLIDLTDPVAPAQQQAIIGLFDEFADSGLKRGEHVTVWTLSAERDGALQRRFSGSDPGRDANPIWSNPRFVAERRESLFVAPLRRALGAGAASKSSPKTPLLEAMHEVCGQPEFDNRTVPRRLVVVSNLEQNSDLWSYYRTSPDFNAFRASPAFAAVRVDLRGVDVDVLYVPRGLAATTLSHSLEDFWRAYFHECGAKSVRFWRL